MNSFSTCQKKNVQVAPSTQTQLTINVPKKQKCRDLPLSKCLEKRPIFGFERPLDANCIVPQDENLTSFYYEGYDGHGNNETQSKWTWGKSDTPLLRKVTQDPSRDPLVNSLPNPRTVSNIVCIQDGPDSNDEGLSDLVWAWGQFVDHELDLTPAHDPVEDASFQAPNDDPDLPNATISFSRSVYELDANNKRQQINKISAYMDDTNVYGYASHLVNVLRLHDGSGKLKTSTSTNNEVILPENDLSINIEMAKLSFQTNNDMLAAGDVRANENILLSAIHTLFLREHNRLCDEYVNENGQWLGNDDKIFHEARKINIALEQHITYNEFLPILLGPDAIPPYTGYKPNVNASIATEFSTVAYRVGHTMLSSDLKIGNGNEDADFIALKDAFFNPQFLRDNGADLLINGAMKHVMQKVDVKIVEDVRSFLFGPPGNGMLLDLASLNIQRGRDHQIPDYNTCRVVLGLAPKLTFNSITSDANVANKLSAAYGGNINIIDPWVGGLAEDHVIDAQVGEFFWTIIRDQFIRLRDGDRFYFENDPTISNAKKQEIKNTKLSDVIKRNTSLTGVQSNVFYADD